MFLTLGLGACAGVVDRRPLPDKREAGGGVVLAAAGVEYAGSAATCTAPATFDFAKVRAATPEWSEIERERIAADSARHRLLTARLHQRLTAAAAKVGRDLGCDLVTRNGDIVDPCGLSVRDVTEAMCRSL